MKTLIVFSHSYFVNSRINKALLQAVSTLPNVTVRNLDELYGSDFSKIDVATEQKYLTEHDRIVFQFPTFWFNMPSMLKAYMDNVFTHGWAYGSTGHALEGKEFVIATSTGSSKEKYDKNGIAVEKFLNSLLTSAAFVGMKVQAPFVTYDCHSKTQEDLEKAACAYVELLKE